MNFSCTSCGRAYSIDDGKVQGRAFRVTCRQCGAEIRVAATRPAGGARTVAAPGSAAPPAQTAGPTRPASPAIAPEAARPAPPPPHPPRPAAPAPRAPSPATTEVPRAQPRPHLTPPTTQVAGEGMTAPRQVNPAMTDEEMAWLAGSSPGASSTLVRGSTTDVEAAAAALEPTAQGTGPAPSQLDGTPDELPPLPQVDEPEPPHEETGEAPRRGPGALRIAAAAVLVLAAGGIAAWQLGWLSSPPPPAPPPPPVVAAAPAPAVEPPPAVAPVEEPPPAEPEPATPAAPPAPAPGGQKRASRDERGTGKVRIDKKDRRLLDLLEKKGDVAPAGTVERATLDTGLGELDQPAVERTLAENNAAFAACVTRALKANPDLRVDDRMATLMLTVRPDGTVSKAWVAEADIDGTPLGRCLVSAARRVVFPAFQGAALDVSAPLKLGAIR